MRQISRQIVGDNKNGELAPFSHRVERKSKELL